MRRVRTSTWILTAVFLITLVTYVLVRPPQAATAGNPSTTGQPSSPSPSPTSPAPSPDTVAVTVNHHVDANREGHASEFGVPD